MRPHPRRRARDRRRPRGHRLRDGSFDIAVLQEPPSQELAATYGVTAEFFVVTAEPERLARLAEMIDAGKLHVAVAATFPLADGRAAYERGATRRQRPGKTFLVVRD